MIRLLDEAGIPYMLTGSLAAAYYATPRATQDIDLVIEPTREQLDTLVDGLTSAGLYVDRDAAQDALRQGSQFNAIDPESGWKIDLIIRKNRAFSETEFSRRSAASVLGVQITLTSREDLILAKLEWSKLGDSELQRRDVAQLVEASRNELDRAYIDEWVRKLDLEESWRAVLDRIDSEDA